MSDTLIIRINRELKTALAEAARRDDRTMSSFARRALAEAVREASR